MREYPQWVIEEAKRLGLDHTNPKILMRLWIHWSVCAV